MDNNKIEMFDLLKIPMRLITENGYALSLEPNQEKAYLISQPDSPLFQQLELIRDDKAKKKIIKRQKDEIDDNKKLGRKYKINLFIPELIYVEAKYNKKKQDQLERILTDGFKYNGKRYKRFGKSASQAKAGITVFIDKQYYDQMMERSQLGLDIAKCVISKYESQRCLIFSSCHIVDEPLPHIVIVDEFEKTIPNQDIRYAVEKDIRYSDPDTGKSKVAKNRKFINEGKRDIKISPFDGFGVHTEEMSKMLSQYLPKGHQSILFQIRLPFMKGVSVQAPIREYLKNECHVEKIKDIFGQWHNVDDIDCIWNTSMWKGYKNFKQAFGNNAWDEYKERLDKYQYKLGISKYNHNLDEINLKSRLNFQYLQCLNLDNEKYIKQFKDHDKKYDILDENNWGKIIHLAKYSTQLLEKIINGDKLYTLKFLGIKDTEKDTGNDSKYIKAILLNDDMLHDPPIRRMLKRKLNKYINQMKMGKIYANGFYHIIVGDIIAYLQYCAGYAPNKITGCLNEHEFYTQTYGNGTTCLAMRSPLVDPSEVNKIHIVKNSVTEKYLDYFHNTDVAMVNIKDISLQQMGGADEDGDIVFITDEQILVESKIDLPIVVDIDDKKTVDPVPYDVEHIIEYEKHSRDSRIGEITNIATSILNQYTKSKKWRKINQDNVALLRLFQGKEIDYLKTGFRWYIPKNLRRYLKKLPFFLLFNYPKKMKIYNRLLEMNKGIEKPEDKVKYNVYWSPSPLNELCEYICRWEQQLVWNDTSKDNYDLVINHRLDNENKISDTEVLKKARKICREFAKDYKENIDNKKNLNAIIEKYRTIVDKLLGAHEKDRQDRIANYCIKVSYESQGRDKLLCWSLFGDTILENIKENTNKINNYVIIESNEGEHEAKEFLGKYYTIETKDGD